MEGEEEKENNQQDHHGLQDVQCSLVDRIGPEHHGIRIASTGKSTRRVVCHRHIKNAAIAVTAANISQNFICVPIYFRRLSKRPPKVLL